MSATVKPDPDPTTLTTEQLFRSLATAREITDVQFTSRDRLTDLLRDLLKGDLALIRQEIFTQVIHRKEVSDEKFRGLAEMIVTLGAGIQLQFAERDIRSKAAELAAQVAVGAALQAAKEAVGEQNKSSALAIAKSETATTKQIDQLQTLLQTNSEATNDKINDIKARMDRGEGGTRGVQTNNQTLVTLVALGLTAIAVGFAIFGHPATPPVVYAPAPAVARPP